MRIIIFGAAGQVGSDCCDQLDRAGFKVIPITRGEVDFANIKDIISAIDSHKPDMVINACAYTAVDKAESEAKLAEQINHLSVAGLARVCAEDDIPLIHLSTDYVFDGTGKVPYRETDPVKPLGIYGISKQKGEQAIQDSCQHFIILRTSWVFGQHGNNFVKTMLRVGAEREILKVVDDQRGRPSYVGDIVNSIQTFIERYQDKGKLPWGIYHCSSNGETTWYGFAEAIFSTALATGTLKKLPKVEPITSSEYPTPAPRPKYSVLSTEKLETFLGYNLPHWQQGLEKFFKQIKNNKNIT